MDNCIKDDNCRNDLSNNYGIKLTNVVNIWRKGLLKKINSVQNLIITSESNNFYFIGTAVEILEKSVTPQCKSAIKLYNQFPFYYQFSGNSEAEGKYSNMNCFFADSAQFTNLQKCIPIEQFNIYDKKREIVVKWTENVCTKSWFFKKCNNEDRVRTDVYIDKVICYKQSNRVYDVFVEIAKMDLMKENGGKSVVNLFQELPQSGTSLKNSCQPNCKSCYSFDKCNECEQQYSMINSECLKCHSTCLSCSDQDYFAGCLSCQPKLVLFNKQCIQQCPDGYISLNGICEACDKNCKTCSKFTYNCIECFQGLVLQGNKCLSKCNEGFYLDYNSQKCLPCQLGCIDCISEKFCKYCDKQFSKQTVECVSQCSHNYVSINGICNVCNNKCDGCVDNVDKCIKCTEGLYMFNGVCENFCQDGYYGDTEKRTCERCDANCNLCRGPKPSDCVSCAANTCVQQLFDANKQIKSMQCLFSLTQNCEICGDKGVCLKCKKNKLLINGAQENDPCGETCPESYHQEGDVCFLNDQSNYAEKTKSQLKIFTIGLFLLLIGFAY